ncbi:DNA replication complex GINS protein SLD5-like isoform X2 [Scylla paramamosain]
MSPTLERHQTDLVDCMLDQINQMTENLKRCKKQDFRAAVHKMEIDRIRYVLSSYLRVRLEKIERYAHHLLEKDASVKDQSETVLSPEEASYAKEYVSSMESHFQKVVLQQMPEIIRGFDAVKECVRPNLESYIFLKVKEATPGVLLEDDTGDGRDEEVDLEEGSQYLMRYNTVKDLLQSGAVVFI